MGVKRTLVEIVHDEGYGDSLLAHINIAFLSKDMQAMRVVPPAEINADQVAPPAIEEIPSISELRYGPEMWPVDKTVIYNAITAIATALTYMPHVDTAIPRFVRALQNDIEQMERAVAALRRAEPWDPSMPIPGKDRSEGSK